MEKLFGGVVLSENQVRGRMNGAAAAEGLLEPRDGELEEHPAMRAARLGEEAAAGAWPWPAGRVFPIWKSPWGTPARIR